MEADSDIVLAQGYTILKGTKGKVDHREGDNIVVVFDNRGYCRVPINVARECLNKLEWESYWGTRRENVWGVVTHII